MALFDFSALPGLSAAQTTAERMFLWGKHEQTFFRSGILLSTSTDNGNSPTTTIRSGMTLAQLSTGKWVPYKATASDGSQLAQGILSQDVKLTDPYGNLSDHTCIVVVGGPVKGNQLLYNAPVQASTTLSGADQQVRAQLAGAFIFDDQLQGNSNAWTNVVAKTAAYTVKATDTGTEFMNTGASGSVTFTLPALLDANSNPVCKGCIYRFTTTAAQALVVAAAGSDKLYFYNDTAHSTATFTNKVGITLEVRTDDAGTHWVSNVIGTVTSDITMS